MFYLLNVLRCVSFLIWFKVFIPILTFPKFIVNPIKFWGIVNNKLFQTQISSKIEVFKSIGLSEMKILYTWVQSISDCLYVLSLQICYQLLNLVNTYITYNFVWNAYKVKFHGLSELLKFEIGTILESLILF